MLEPASTFPIDHILRDMSLIPMSQAAWQNPAGRSTLELSKSVGAGTLPHDLIAQIIKLFAVRIRKFPARANALTTLASVSQSWKVFAQAELYFSILLSGPKQIQKFRDSALRAHYYVDQIRIDGHGDGGKQTSAMIEDIMLSCRWIRSVSIACVYDLEVRCLFHPWLSRLKCLSLIQVTFSASPADLNFRFILSHFETDLKGMAPQIFAALGGSQLASLDLTTYEHRWLTNFQDGLLSFAPRLTYLALYFFDLAERDSFDPSPFRPFLSRLHNLKSFRCYARHGKLLQLIPGKLALWEPQFLFSDSGEWCADLKYLFRPGGELCSAKVERIRLQPKDSEVLENGDWELLEKECGRNGIVLDCRTHMLDENCISVTV